MSPSDIIAADADRILAKVDLSELSGKRVLVSGASGLIGSYFIACLARLAARGAKFTTIALTGSAPPEHVRPFLDRPGVEVRTGDLTDPDFCRALPQADYIIHSAGYGQPGRFLAGSIKTLQLCTSATFALLEKLAPGGKFLYLSTSEVYSGLPQPPHKESEIGTTDPTHPRSCYIEGKRCGEAICNSYRAKGVDAKSARVCLAYGPGTKAGDARVINSFIEKAMAGKIALMDQGEARRTYGYISDAVETMWNILLRGKQPVYNVGGFSKTTIGDLARLVGKAMNVPVVFPQESKNLAGSPEDVSLDMERVHSEFGRKSYVPLEEGLARTIAFQKALAAQGAAR